MNHLLKNLTLALTAVILLVSVAALHTLSPATSALVHSSEPTTPFAVAPSASGVDLTIESLTLEPDDVQPGQEATITVVVKNSGSSDMGFNDGFYIHLYVLDATDGMPDETTTEVNYTRSIGLAAGKTFSYEYTDEALFSTEGCYRVVAWVDRDNEVAEDDETNNLQSLIAGTCECPEDAYEPNDTCAQATTLAVGQAAQQHTFCPAGDTDWIVFAGKGGATYDIVSKVAEDSSASVVLELYNQCGGFPSFSDGTRLSLTLPTDGQYYLKVTNATEGIQTDTGYTISITEQADCRGSHEPNNYLATASDIPTDGTRQQHNSCKPGDEDWVKFSTLGGQDYTIRATLTMTDDNPYADPQIEVYQQTADGLQLVENPETVSSPTDATFYARMRNSPGEGELTSYDLAVEPLDITEDAFEPDNTLAEATPITVNGVPQEHTISSPNRPDRDILTFAANAGQTYTIETVGLRPYADTVVCLLDGTGNVLPQYCDDENGANHGSRLTWTAPADGMVFVQITHADEHTAGPDTAYLVSVVTGYCQPDTHEPDDTSQQAKALSLDGTSQSHTFCSQTTDSAPAGDRDWYKLSLPTPGTYHFETSQLAPGSDTELLIYASDGETVLARNDDYGPGLASQLVYEFKQAGTYFLEMRHFNPTQYGTGTAYALSALPASKVPSPTPTPEPKTEPEPMPAFPEFPASQVKTLILTNRERLEALYGAAEVDDLLRKLITLSEHPEVQGEIILLDNNQTVATAYEVWRTQQHDAATSVTAANQTATAIRNLILEYTATRTAVEYIVLVGNDHVIPYRRIPDRTNPDDQESSFGGAPADTTVGIALASNMFLSDDYYAASTIHVVAGQELSLPDRAIGRLVETPDQIAGVIDSFLASSTLDVEHTLVAGYDVLSDLGTQVCGLFQFDLANMGIGVNCDLLGDTWTGEQFKNSLVASNVPFKLLSLNVHANHECLGTPDANSIYACAADIQSGTSDLRNALIYTPGCHAGLNVPDTRGTLFDLPQVFARRQATYVGNTGYGYGNQDTTPLSERLMQLYTDQLLRGTVSRIGTALTIAKHRYAVESMQHGFGPYDEKVLQQVVLYGLPMYTLQTSSAMDNQEPFPGVQVANVVPSQVQAAIQQDDTVLQGTLTITVAGGTSLQNGLAQTTGFSTRTTDRGSYVALDGHTLARINTPVLPHFYLPGETLATPSLRGVRMVRASYITDTLDDAVIESPIRLELGAENHTAPEADFEYDGFYPAQLFSRSADSVSDGFPSLSFVMGQVDTTNNVQRLYHAMEYETLYSGSSDVTPPEITSVQGYYDSGLQQATFKVEVTDTQSEINSVQVCLAQDGMYSCAFDLSYDAASQKWRGSFSQVLPNADYYMQTVDAAGNVAVQARKHGYFELSVGTWSTSTPTPTPTNTPTPTPTNTPTPSPTPTAGRMFLPLVER